jgi:predicted molibdopterin-dependent oxidoreductase YjgC
MPAQSLAQIFVLDLNNKCWTSVFCQRNVRNVHGHSALMMKDRWMVTFGGHTMNENGGGNEMYCVDCANITTMVPVNQMYAFHSVFF